MTEFLKPQAPLWACELTAKHVIAAGVNSRRTRVSDKVAANFPVLENVGSAKPIVQQVLSQIGFKGSEIAVVVPDEIARIAFLTVEKPSKHPEEQRTFIRWKLKKSLPFDVDMAQVAYHILGPHNGGHGVDMLVALSPRSVVREYEKLFDDLNIHAGTVLPSTLAALNLLTPPVV